MRRNQKIETVVFLLLGMFLSPWGLCAQSGIQIENGGLTLTYDQGQHTLSLRDKAEGLIFKQASVRLKSSSVNLSTADENTSVQVNSSQPIMTVQLGADHTLELQLKDAELMIRGTGSFEQMDLSLDSGLGSEGKPAFLKGQEKEAKNVLITRMGPASIPGARSLFDANRDVAVSVEADTDVNWWFDQSWKLSASAQKTIKMTLQRNYYKETLGIEYYAPLDKRSFWETAPIVAMTWYGICGKNQPQTLGALKPEIDWVAENLAPYAEKMVFQLDDNYDLDADEEMRGLSDYIRSKGLIPGIWFTPFNVAPQSAATANPDSDMFIKDKEGELILSFGGRNFAWYYGVHEGARHPGDEGAHHQAGTLNVTNQDALDQWYEPFWHKVNDTWNFDFFKIDAQPEVIKEYQKAVNVGSDKTAAYRKGLERAREIVGPDKFINGCWGPMTEHAGLVTGTRTGNDTGDKGHALNFLLAYNYLNNIVWWGDADAAANQWDKPVESVRLNSQARALTGQQFVTDDFWTKMPEDNTYVWQRSFPNLDAVPCNLYKINAYWKEVYKDYDLIDLRVAKPWGTFDVVGLFNYGDEPISKTIEIARLPLDADAVHVYEYWSSTYLGVFSDGDKIERELKSIEGQVFTMIPVASDDRPVWISSSRHISQGGLDLVSLTERREGNKWIVEGTSAHLVSGDPYQLTFAQGNYRLVQATADGLKVEVENKEQTATLNFVPKAETTVRWTAVFELDDEGSS